MWAYTWTSVGGHNHGEVRARGRLPGQTSPCHFQWAHSTFPPPSCHSSPRHDRQIHLSRKEELILYISETVIDLLLHRTNEIRLKLLWGFTGNWPCQSFAATKCCTTSLKFNVNLARICSFTLPYFHNANVSISDFDCPLAEKLPAAPTWCREWCKKKNGFESIIQNIRGKQQPRVHSRGSSIYYFRSLQLSMCLYWCNFNPFSWWVPQFWRPHSFLIIAAVSI